MKIKHLFILLTLFTNEITAQDICSRPNEHSQPVEQPKLDSLSADLDDIQRKTIAEGAIDWWSADEKMVRKANCQVKVPTLEEINSYFGSYPRTIVKAEIMGFKVENESSDLIEAMTDLLYKKDWKGEFKGDYKGKVPSTCKKVKCMAENIFGKELGPKLLYLKKRYGINASEYVHSNSSRLTINEADTFIKAASYFPSFLLPLDKNKQMTKFKRGYVPAGTPDSVIANATITFFDSWTYQSPDMKKYTVFHEMSHYLAAEFNLDENTKWLNISGWEKVGDEWKKSVKNVFSSKYGTTNPWEDFAEAATAYRFNPNLLKNASPEKYDFLKEAVFQGIEYTSEESCQGKNSYSAKLNQEKGKFVQPLPVKADAAYLTKIIDSTYLSCGQKVIDIMVGENDSFFKECVTKAIPLKINPATNGEKILEAIVKPLKYPELVKASITKTEKNNSIKYNNEDVAKFQEKNFVDIKLNFEKQSLNIQKKLIAKNDYNIKYGSDEDYKNFVVCDKISTYVYQDYKIVDTMSKNEFLTYNNSDKFEKFTKELCRQMIKNGAGRDKNFSDAEISKAYIQIKSKNDDYYKKLSLRIEAITASLQDLERNSNFLTRMSSDYTSRKASLESEYNGILLNLKWP